MLFKDITIVYLKGIGSKEIFTAGVHLLPIILRAFFQGQTQPNRLELVHVAILLFYFYALFLQLSLTIFLALANIFSDRRH